MTKLYFLFCCLFLFTSTTNSASLTVDQQETLQVLVDIQNIATDVFRIVAMTVNFFHFNKVGGLWFTYQVKILEYPKYLEIWYPERLSYVLIQPQYELFSIPYLSRAPDKVIKEVMYYPMPLQFMYFGNHSSFLINFWPYMIILAIILVLIVIAVLLDCCTESSKSLHPIFAKFNQALKWNYLIAIFIGNFCDIALFTSLEMRTIKFANYFEWISFFVCIFVNIGVLAVFIRLAFIVNRLGNEKAVAVQTGNSWKLDVYKTQMKEYVVVFDDFKDETRKEQSYILVFMIRLYIFYVIIAYLFEYPFVQSIIINVLGIAMLVYLTFVRPFKSKIDLISAILQEVILELMNLCVFALALADENNYIIEDFRTVMGGIIIGCNVAFMVVGALYLLILALFVLKDVFTALSKECTDQKVAPYNINIIPAEKEATPHKFPQNSRNELNASDTVNESNIHLNRPTRPTRPERRPRNEPVNMSRYEPHDTMAEYQNDRSFNENMEHYQYGFHEPEPVLHNPYVKNSNIESRPHQASREKIYYVDDPSSTFNDVLHMTPLDLANSKILRSEYRLNLGSPRNGDKSGDDVHVEPTWKKRNPYGSQSKESLF